MWSNEEFLTKLSKNQISTQWLNNIIIYFSFRWLYNCNRCLSVHWRFWHVVMRTWQNRLSNLVTSMNLLTWHGILVTGRFCTEKMIVSQSMCLAMVSMTSSGFGLLQPWLYRSTALLVHTHIYFGQEYKLIITLIFSNKCLFKNVSLINGNVMAATI